jgi:DNA-binding NarL/FixJ family response regulator
MIERVPGKNPLHPDRCAPMETSEKTRIVFVSEPGVMREAMQAVLAALPQVSIVGLAGGSLSALHLLQQREADVVIIDANIPVDEMLALVRSIKALRLPVACIALASTRSQMRLAVAEGANAALPRRSPPRQISEAIQTAAGSIFLNR